ncbi:MAG: helix-turn-helix domain-containing protein [Elainellaceae cyanobacterium]
MAPKKLSDSDKQEILKLYHQPQETTSTLASRYGVSNSTISRILKQSLSEDAYEALVQQKRAGSTKASTAVVDVPASTSTPAEPPVKKSTEPPVEPPVKEPTEQPIRELIKEPSQDAVEAVEDDVVKAEQPTPAVEPPKKKNRGVPDIMPARRRRRRGSSDSPESDDTFQDEEPVVQNLESREPKSPASPTLKADRSDPGKQDYEEEASIYAEVLHEDLLDPEEDFTNLVDEDGDDLDEDDSDEDYGLEDEGGLDDFASARLQGKTFVSILPLSDASIPKPCYLVIDRASELITRPLKDFAELGQIPDGEIQERTLPVFDNHRVARRFSNRRTQRVVKIPDGQLLQKTSSYLQAKGITRMLIDGQVYSLERF